MPEVGNRVIYAKATGEILTQLGEMQGDVLPRTPIDELGGLAVIDLPFGAINHETERLVSIDPETGEPVTEKIERPQTEAERIKELEDQLLLAAENEVGGVL